ncbi:MAG: carbohydrate ABC transporter substrate-binding protein [Anaerolineae bacterium]|nr:carbohydrate ABC transporter substrate-binding protein [Anaerolineae bacterium]
MKKLLSVPMCILMIGTILTACGTTEVVTTSPPKAEMRQLEIFHWWTAAGEQEAADIMFEALATVYPDIEVIQNPVEGGGGVGGRVVLQARMDAGLPPDTWQALGGAELKAYVDSGYLEPLDDLWDEIGLADLVPGPLANAVTIDGHPYVVPLNMHLENILYYNTAVFDELELTLPTNYDELMEACETITREKPDMVPLAVGSKEKWGAVFVLDTLMLEVGGPDYYVQFFKGEIDVERDENFKTSLERLESLLPYINEDHMDLTWDQSVSMVGSEKAAMVIMGTWAIGALEKGSGWTAGKDFGAVTFPQEPERILLFHPDTYGLAKNAPHPEAALDWLRVVASPELQIPTDVTQGGLFARIDIDPAEFPDAIRQELQAYVSEKPDKLILDQHGSIAPHSFTTPYWNAIVDFMISPKVDSTISAVALLFSNHNVKEQAAWYQWP